jgi:hypothetical protein
MKRITHAAALVLVGWYLIVPPLTAKAPRQVNYKAPLTYWHISGSYDTAAKCREAESKLFNDTMSVYRNDETLLPSPAQARITAECIASDDPRLKAK